MSVICDSPEGHMLYCKGAPESVLPLCSEMLLQGTRLPLDEAGRTSLLSSHEQMTERGLRVIALAYRRLPNVHGKDAAPDDETRHARFPLLNPLPLAGEEANESRREFHVNHAAQRESELIFAGLIGLVDPPREAVPEAVRTCHAAGIRVSMITGDHPHTASALAREIGLAQNPLAVTGDKLRNMSDTDLQLLLDEPDLIFARTSADQKMRIVQALQRKGEIVAVTGDGVNDAPALKSADVGIAMGISGTDVAKESEPERAGGEQAGAVGLRSFDGGACWQDGGRGDDQGSQPQAQDRPGWRRHRCWWTGRSQRHQGGRARCR